MGDEEMALEIIDGGDGRVPREVGGGGIDAQRIIRELAHDEAALLRAVEGHHDIGLAARQGKGAGQRHELDGEFGVALRQCP